MYRLATKCTTKNEAHLSPNIHSYSVSTAASRHSAVRCDCRRVCRDCRVPTAVHVQRGVRIANLRTQIRSNCSLD